MRRNSHFVSGYKVLWADIVADLYFREMNVDPKNPRWEDRDRFVLSKGHVCPIQYSALGILGFFPEEDLHTLRKEGSKFQGHSSMNKCPGIDISTGFLGQGLSCAVGMALAGKRAGLATCGKIPFVVTYAVFGSLRMCEQIRQEICYPKLNVKIACSHGGVTPANDGASHQCIEDMGVLRTLPNMTIIMPADYWSARRLVEAAAEFDGPVYLRFTRDAIPVIYDENATFEIGKANKLKEGKDIAIIANGDTVRLAIEAAEKLEAEGIHARVLDMHTIKPLDVDAVKACINDIGKIITVEDHNIINGLGGAVCEVVAEAGKGKVKRVGIQDQFGQSAPYERLLAINGITVENIVELAKGEW